MEILKIIGDNFKDLLSIFGGVVFVASCIVGVTKNTKDNSFVGKIISLFDKVSVLQTEENKKLIDMARERIKEDEH